MSTTNYIVRKTESGQGWDIVDTRIGVHGALVDFEHYKKDAIVRASLWNSVNPQLSKMSDAMIDMHNEHQYPSDMTPFENLLNQMSPENLYMDGEISKTRAMARLRKLKAEWKRLEKLLGRKVYESELY